MAYILGSVFQILYGDDLVPNFSSAYRIGPLGNVQKPIYTVWGIRVYFNPHPTYSELSINRRQFCNFAEMHYVIRIFNCFKWREFRIAAYLFIRFQL